MTTTKHTPPQQPVYTDCANCGTCDHRDYACPCGCHPTTKHAPGPWTIAYPIPADGTADVRRESPKRQITVRRSDAHTLAQMLNECDARFSLVLDLLAACKELEAWSMSGRIPGAAWVQVRAAIAKAEGGNA